FLFIYSAAYRNADQGISGMVARQMVWAVIGFGVYITAAVFDYRKLSSLHWWIYGGVQTLLILVLFIGTSIYGAHRWFSIGGIMIQPSEFGKLSLIFTLSAWLGNPSTDPGELPVFFKSFLLAGVPFLLIAAEPDLGTAMVL